MQWSAFGQRQESHPQSVRCSAAIYHQGEAVGKVACGRHGTHVGILSCDHVRKRCEDQLAPPVFGSYRIDLMGDGRGDLDANVCAACAEQSGLRQDEIVGGKVFEDESRFPFVCPTCVQCIAESLALGS